MAKGIFWVALLGLLTVSPILVAPLAQATAPAPIPGGPYSTNQQDITSFTMDARGRFAAAVVKVDPLATTALNKCSATGGKCDVFFYDLIQQTSWRATHDMDPTHQKRTTTLTENQVVAAAPEPAVGLGVFAVGGPDGTVARWTTVGDVASWEQTTWGSNFKVEAITINKDGSLIWAGANGLNNARIDLYRDAGSRGRLVWSYNLTDVFSDSPPPQITQLRLSRDGGVLFAATNKGLLMFDATQTRDAEPPKPAVAIPNSVITSVQPSADGRYAVVGTATTDGGGYVFFFDVADRRSSAPAIQPWSRGTGSKVNVVAISNDRAYFGAGTQDGKLWFYRHTAPPLLAAEMHKAIQLDGPVVSMDYSTDGSVLVVATERSLYGFHPSRDTALWQLAAPQAGLDAPLRGVVLSDSGERFILVGKTKTALYTQRYAGDATLQPTRDTVNPGASRTYVVTVTNTGSAADTYNLTVHRPGGWMGTEERSKTILPGEQRTFNVTLQPPAAQGPGARDIQLEVRSAGIQRLRSSTEVSEAEKAKLEPVVKRLTLNLTVVAVSDIRLEQDKVDLELKQGIDHESKFTVKNLGNSEAIVNLTAREETTSGSRWSLRLEHAQMRIPAGGSAQNTLYIKAPPDAPNGQANVIKVQASVGGRTLTELRYSARVNPEFQITLTTSDDLGTYVVPVGGSKVVKILIKNTGNTADKVDLSHQIQEGSGRQEWRASLDRTTIDLPFGATRSVSLTVRPASAQADETTITVSATSQGSGDVQRIPISVQLAPQEESPAQKVLPGAPPVLVLAAVLSIALAARRVRAAARVDRPRRGSP